MKVQRWVIVVLAVILLLAGALFALGSALAKGEPTDPIPPTPTLAPPCEPVKLSHPVPRSDSEIEEICASIDLASGVSIMAMLLQPANVEYVPLPASTTEVTASGPVAYLADPPVELTESIGLFAPPRRSWLCPNALEFAILAGVRYKGDGHTVLVSTVEFSPAAKEAYARGEVVLGYESIILASGTPAWFSEETGLPTPNWVAMEEGDLLICVASDLPREEVEALAAQVVFDLGSLEQ